MARTCAFGSRRSVACGLILVALAQRCGAAGLPGPPQQGGPAPPQQGGGGPPQQGAAPASPGGGAITAVRVCLTLKPPFVMPRVWQGLSLSQLSSTTAFADPYGISGVTFAPSNASMLDGYDVAFVQLVLTTFKGWMVTYLPYPDQLSMYVGMLNGDCDLAVGANKLDADRVACANPAAAGSPAGLPVYSGALSASAAYVSRWSSVVCLDYGLPYYTSGYAILSLPTAAAVSVGDSVLSVDLLNVATALFVAIFGFGFVMYFVEKQNPLFRDMETSVYYSFVTIATVGYGDVAPVTRTGKLMAVAWMMFGTISLISLSSVVSSKLVIGGLAATTIDSLSQLDPSSVCVDSSDAVLNQYLASQFGIPMATPLTSTQLVLDTLAGCMSRMAAGSIIAVVGDKPVLEWASANLYASSGFYVSGSVFDQYISWAFPAKSAVRADAQVALLAAFTNVTWISSREALESTWFVSAPAVSLTASSPIFWPTLWTSVAMAGAFLVHVGAKRLYKLVKVQRQAAAIDKQGKSTDAASNGDNEHQIRALTADVAALAQRGAVLVNAFETRSGREHDPIFRRLWRQQAVALKAIDRRFLTLAEDMQQLVHDEDEILVLMENERQNYGDDADGAGGRQSTGRLGRQSTQRYQMPLSL
jgi:voltage-gated potassium channel Kch